MDPFIKKFVIGLVIVIVIIVGIGIWASGRQEDTKYSYNQVDSQVNSTETQSVSIRSYYAINASGRRDYQ